MNFITGYLYRGMDDEGVSGISLLLQQMNAGRHHVVLACICDGDEAGGYVTGRIKGWLSKYAREMSGEKIDIEKFEDRFGEELIGIESDLDEHRIKRENGGKVNLSGILALDQDCIMMRGGSGCLYLFNRRFMRSHCRRVGGYESGAWQLTPGRLQKGIGLLIGYSEFCKSIPRDKFNQVLSVSEIEREIQITKRLKSLWEESRREGFYGECAAIYIKVGV